MPGIVRCEAILDPRPLNLSRFWRLPLSCPAWIPEFNPEHALDPHPAAERWPIAGSFAISRGAKTEAVVVVAELGDGKARGRGECVPYARYGESVESVTARRSRPCGRGSAAGLDRDGLAKRPCRRAPRAMRSTARSGTSRPSAAGARCMNSPACPPRSRSPPPIRSRSARPPPWPRPPPRPPAAPLLKVKLGGDDDRRRPRAHRRGARRRAQGDADRRRQ